MGHGELSIIPMSLPSRTYFGVLAVVGAASVVTYFWSNNNSDRADLKYLAHTWGSGRLRHC
jgi:hypothetical protein